MRRTQLQTTIGAGTFRTSIGRRCHLGRWMRPSRAGFWDHLGSRRRRSMWIWAASSSAVRSSFGQLAPCSSRLSSLVLSLSSSRLSLAISTTTLLLITTLSLFTRPSCSSTPSDVCTRRLILSSIFVFFFLFFCLLMILF